jgi:Pyruvate/2-oxoglutarate dehydrogenase complex, dehydrogenase (E1) component, eukaryotic type, beta subunit
MAYGPTVKTALQSAELASVEGLDIEVIDLRSLSPFDDETVGASVRKTSRAAIIHEASQFGGYGAEVAARVTEREFFHLAAPILRITGSTSRSRRPSSRSTTSRRPSACSRRSTAGSGERGHASSCCPTSARG